MIDYGFLNKEVNRLSIYQTSANEKASIPTGMRPNRDKIIF